MADEDIADAKRKTRRRSGLLLDDEAVLNAMESGEEKLYLPLGVREQKESLASAEHIKLLSGHIDCLLEKFASELRAGSISAEPYCRSQSDTACNICEFADACRFNAQRDGLRIAERLSAEKVWELLEKGKEED